MAIQPKPMTVEDFEALVKLPENEDRLFELLMGELIERSPGRTRNSEIGHRLAVVVHLFCKEHGLPCHTSGGDGAYRILDSVVAPDFAYKRSPMSDEYPDPIAPLWAVEIISPTDKAPYIRNKRAVYRDAGILLWEIYPQVQTVDVYAPGQAPLTVNVDGKLDGGDILPDFWVSAAALFDA